jgi:tetratricopeptide (TPR) repeat protein
MNQENLIALIHQLRNLVQEDRQKTIVRKIEHYVSDRSIDINLKFQAQSVLGSYFKSIRNYDRSAGYFRDALNSVFLIDDAHANVIIQTYLEYIALETEYKQYKKARIYSANLLNWLDRHSPEDFIAYGLTYKALGKLFFEEENYPGGIAQLEKALDYFRKKLPEEHPIFIELIQVMSNAYIELEKYDQALSLYENILNKKIDAEDKFGEALILLRIGEIDYYKDLKQARSNIMKALNIFQELGEQVQKYILKAYLMLGEIDENIANYPRAINYYKKACQVIEKQDRHNQAMIVFIYSKIGMISIKMNELDKAKLYLEKGLPISESFANIRMQFLYGLGKIYSLEKKYEQAFQMYTKFLQGLEQTGHKVSKSYADTLQALAFNFLQQKQFETALNYYEQARIIYNQLMSTSCREEKGLTYMRIGYCYENLVRPDLKKAEQFYEQGFEILSKVKSVELLEEGLAALIDFYRRYKKRNKQKIYEDKLVKLQNMQVKKM